MAAQVVKQLPDEPDWIFEVKFDGYRALILKDRARIEIRSRNDRDLTKMYPEVVAAALTIPVTRPTIDGEIVALDPSGRPTFQALQHRGANREFPIVFYAFDLLHLEGADITGEPLLRRRTKLANAIGHSEVRMSEALPGSATTVVSAVREPNMALSWRSRETRG